MPTYSNTVHDEVLQLPDGRVMGYAQYGDEHGIPVFAVHGTPGSRKMMEVADDYSQQRGIRLIAPDRPGYGLSSSLDGYHLHQWVADVKVLLDVLDVERFYLFGVSGGGPFAVAIATLMPHRVRALALASPVGLFTIGVRKSWSLRNALFFNLLPRIPFLMKLVFPALRFFIFKAPSVPLKIFVRSLGRSDRVILRQPRFSEQLLIAAREGFAQGVEGILNDLRIFSDPWQLSLEKASMRIIIWQGNDDRMVPPQATQLLADALPNPEIIVLKEAGHFWIFDHFEEVLERLLKCDEAQN